ncbi:ABC transporter ATP-binding protein/permease [Candidatus Pelagibacter sp.]|nr:ABC transporter ATP-binding protein/permease [Candidatus Pelagibacter sp.]
MGIKNNNMLYFFFVELKKLLGLKLLYKSQFILFLSIVISFLEVISIGSVAAFIGVILQPEKFLEDYVDIKIIQSFLSYDQLLRVKIGSIFLFGLFFFKSIVTFFANYLEQKLHASIKKRLASKIFKSYLSRDYNFFIKNNPAKLWNVVITEVNVISNYIKVIFNFFASVILIIGLFVLIAFTNIQTILIFFILSFIVFLIMKFFKSKIDFWSKERFKNDSNISKSVNQSLGSIKEIKLFNLENIFFNNFFKDLSNNEKLKVYINVINFMPRQILELIGVSSLLLFLYYFTLNNKDISEILPFLTLVALSVIRIVPVFSLLSVQLNSIRFLGGSKHQILKEIRYLQKNDKNKKTIKKIKDKNHTFKEINFRNVNFFYNKKKTILKNLNFRIKKNDRVLIVGPSGSGKTTIINLILGLLEPTSGVIKLNKKNNLDINNVNSWQDKIGLIPQDVYLMDDTIKNNIILYSKEFNKENLDKALKISRLNHEVKKFSKGINSLVGHRGRKLSGGQRQRLALARALYKKPEVLIMDEPTSSIDYKSEMQIINSLVSISKNYTIIMVAHRAEKFIHLFNKIIKI